MLVLHNFNYYNFVVSFQTEKYTSTLSYSFRIILTVLDPLYYHINFKISLSLLYKASWYCLWGLHRTHKSMWKVRPSMNTGYFPTYLDFKFFYWCFIVFTVQLLHFKPRHFIIFMLFHIFRLFTSSIQKYNWFLFSNLLTCTLLNASTSSNSLRLPF